MKIYTKTGDGGDTGLFAGPRVRKDDVRIEAYGTVDELNAFLGQARCETIPASVEKCLAWVQSELFSVGAELATPEPEKHGMCLVGERHIEALEKEIDELQKDLPALTHFILPAGNRGAAALHVARGVCRRAERRVVTLASQPEAQISMQVIQYLNRLGDYLFVAARAANVLSGEAEIAWHKPT
ncbi:MAG: cob(I)yrinic acid a,c-diamide adenosyltransferase [Planctomycetaceae bacterium]